LKVLKTQPSIRTQAAQALAKMGEKAVPALVKLVKDGDEDSRANAVQALGVIGPDNDEVVPALCVAIKDKSLRVRSIAIKLVGDIGAPAKAALPDLLQCLTDPNDTIRNDAMDAMGKKMGKIAVPQLIGALRSRNADIRDKAASALARIGPDAKAAIPALATALADQKESGVRRTAAYALANVIPKDDPAGKAALVPLSAALRDGDADVQRNASLALQNVGEPAVPTLVEALSEKGTKITGLARTSLVAIGAPAVPALIKALEDNNSPAVVRTQVCSVLEQIGPAASDAADALTAAQKDSNKAVRDAAARALKKNAHGPQPVGVEGSSIRQTGMSAPLLITRSSYRS
jgi:HEAT repeat protein